jgi:hypothetical protein
LVGCGTIFLFLYRCDSLFFFDLTWGWWARACVLCVCVGDERADRPVDTRKWIGRQVRRHSSWCCRPL